MVIHRSGRRTIYSTIHALVTCVHAIHDTFSADKAVTAVKNDDGGYQGCWAGSTYACLWVQRLQTGLPLVMNTCVACVFGCDCEKPLTLTLWAQICVIWFKAVLLSLKLISRRPITTVFASLLSHCPQQLKRNGRSPWLTDFLLIGHVGQAKTAKNNSMKRRIDYVFFTCFMKFCIVVCYLHPNFI